MNKEDLENFGDCLEDITLLDEFTGLEQYGLAAGGDNEFEIFYNTVKEEGRDY